MKPVVDRLEREFKGRVEFRRYNVESDAMGQDLAQQLGAQYVPTFVFFDSKGAKVDLVVGEMTEDALRTKLGALR